MLTHQFQSDIFCACYSYAGLNSNLGGFDGYSYVYINNGNKSHNGSSESYGDSYIANDIIGVAFDLDDGKLWWSKNGVWQASGDPGAGTSPAYTGLVDTFSPIYSAYYNNASCAGRFLKSDQDYSVPSGFKALDYILLPSYYFSGYVLENGNPISRIINLHDRNDGSFVATTTSSGNGYYYMETTSSGSHYIVCLDDEAGEEYNDLIIGPAFPITISG